MEIEQELIKPIEFASGLANVKINLKGQILDPNDIVFNKNLFAKGSIEMLSNAIKLNGVQVSNVKGLINFNNMDADFSLISSLNRSVISLDGKIKNKDVNCLIVPYSATGCPAVLSCVKNNIEVVFVKNKTVLNVTADKLNIKGRIFGDYRTCLTEKEIEIIQH